MFTSGNVDQLLICCGRHSSDSCLTFGLNFCLVLTYLIIRKIIIMLDVHQHVFVDKSSCGKFHIRGINAHFA